ncbi:MAG: phosphoribosylformylglycinamidine cyclo-ligase [Tissierellia bacterium]|nr:phosphoribosylformylglycinamidine cyclo-ligase [Tissierellia bacterium]
MSISYKDAGVDKAEGYREVALIKEHIQKTMRPEVMGGIGGFSGLFKLGAYKKPVLVSGTDGVGTKLKFAFLCDIHNTIGIDAVAMCVNDILCQGAEPLFFLDYIATGKLVAEKMASIVEGVAEGCVQSGAALIGGETAEMPGFYKEDEYDIAGFAVGVVEEDEMITSDHVGEGDVLIGIPSSGIHSNGYSLVRKIVFDLGKVDLEKVYEGLDKPLKEELLTPTRIYKDVVFTALKVGGVHGMCHITGGGFYENIPRMIPDGYYAELNLEDLKTPRIFQLLQEWGQVETKEMFSTFNMGIGFVLAVDKGREKEIRKALEEMGEEPILMGQVKKMDENHPKEEKCVL